MTIPVFVVGFSSLVIVIVVPRCFFFCPGFYTGGLFVTGPNGSVFYAASSPMELFCNAVNTSPNDLVGALRLSLDMYYNSSKGQV